jgi:hypothetical protein
MKGLRNIWVVRALATGRVLALQLTLALLLAGCGDDPVAGGGVVEIPNGIAARVVDSTGTPVVGARVRLVWLAGWGEADTASYREVVSDSAGVVRAAWVGERRCRLEVLRDSVGVLTQDVEYRWMDTSGGAVSELPDSLVRPLVLRRMGALTGSVLAGTAVGTNPPGVPTRLRIYGSTLVATLDGNGRFAFPGLPAAELALVETESADWHSYGVARVAAGTALQLDSLQAQEGLLLDDFEGDGLWPAANALGTGARWVAWNDEANGGSATIYPAIGDPLQFAQAISDSAAWSGLSLTVSYDLTTSSWSYPYAALLAVFETPRDLGGLDSVSFMATGAGRVTMALVRPGFEPPDDAIEAEFVPDGTGWWRVVVRRADFAGYPTDAANWEAFTRGVTGLMFLFTDAAGNDLRLDDVVLHGVTPREWAQ